MASSGGSVTMTTTTEQLTKSAAHSTCAYTCTVLLRPVPAPTPPAPAEFCSSHKLRCLSSLARSRLAHRSVILVTSMMARASPSSFVLFSLVGLVSAGTRKVLAFELSCHSFYAPRRSLHSLFSLCFSSILSNKMNFFSVGLPLS
jgi:hypothetical protein